MNITELLKQPEGKTLEFKRDLSSPDKVLRAIIAFANTSGGSIIIGVEDGSKHIRGVADPMALEERLANIISDSIAPKLIPNIEILPWRKTYLVIIEIYPSYSRPHYLKALGLEKSAYVRVGSSNRVADAFLLRELQRFSRTETFDEQPIPELNSEAIDFRVASELFSEYRRLKKTDLATLRLVTTYHGRKVPTVGGMILFGKNREQFFPDAWIQAGYFAGTSRTHIVDSTEIRTYPALAITEAIQFVQKHFNRGAQIESVKRVDQWVLPPVAVREAVINAVVHADYSQKGAPIRISIFSDRLEIENPGLIPFSLTMEDLRQGISKLRNPVIGRVFHELRFIEQWGSGIKRMTEACLEAGLAEPILEEIGTNFRVTFFIQKQLTRQLNAIDETILSTLKNSQGLTTQQIADKINLTARATRNRLRHLIDLGLVIGMGSSPQDPRRKYWLVK